MNPAINTEQTTSKTAQDAKNGGSKPEKVKVYRNGCEGCVHANQGVCCGGVR